MNATLIESLHRASGGSLSFAAGLALLGGLLLWLGLEILRSLLRAHAERSQNRVALQKLRAQLHETKLRCREAGHAWRECTLNPVTIFHTSPGSERDTPNNTFS